jgi:hypothetical protein
MHVPQDHDESHGRQRLRADVCQSLPGACGMTAKGELEQIPGVGESIAQDLRHLGITSVEQLKGKDPERLYRKLCGFKASPVDRCTLYVFRCAVYYASHRDPDPELLKWWNWKDDAQPRARRRRQRQ